MSLEPGAGAWSPGRKWLRLRLRLRLREDGRAGRAAPESQCAEPVLMAAPAPTGPEDDASAVLDELSRNFTYWAPGPGNGSLSSAWYRRNQVRPPAPRSAPPASSMQAPRRRQASAPSCQLSARGRASGLGRHVTTMLGYPPTPPTSAEQQIPRLLPSLTLRPLCPQGPRLPQLSSSPARI